VAPRGLEAGSRHARSRDPWQRADGAVYTSAHVARFAKGGSIVAMPPAQVLGLLNDLELVRMVRFDDELVIDLVDLQLR
jgi:hypothetical protein